MVEFTFHGKKSCWTLIYKITESNKLNIIININIFTYSHVKFVYRQSICMMSSKLLFVNYLLNLSNIGKNIRKDEKLVIHKGS